MAKDEEWKWWGRKEEQSLNMNPDKLALYCLETWHFSFMDSNPVDGATHFSRLVWVHRYYRSACVLIVFLFYHHSPLLAQTSTRMHVTYILACFGGGVFVYVCMCVRARACVGIHMCARAREHFKLVVSSNFNKNCAVTDEPGSETYVADGNN